MRCEFSCGCEVQSCMGVGVYKMTQCSLHAAASSLLATCEDMIAAWDKAERIGRGSYISSLESKMRAAVAEAKK